MTTPLSALLNLRQRSLTRGNLLVILSLVSATLLSDFPNNRATLWLLLPVLSAAGGTFETARCMQRRWSFYHAGVILCIYMDLMAMALILFFLLYPFSHFLMSSH